MEISVRSFIIKREHHIRIRSCWSYTNVSVAIGKRKRYFKRIGSVVLKLLEREDRFIRIHRIGRAGKSHHADGNKNSTIRAHYFHEDTLPVYKDIRSRRECQ